MNTQELVEALDAEIARLDQVKSLLMGETRNGTSGAKRGPSNVTKPKPGKRRSVSPKGRANMVAAQKARWAKVRRGK